MSKKMSKRWLLVIIAAVALLVILAACSPAVTYEPKTQTIDIFINERKAVAEGALNELLGEENHADLITEFYKWEPEVIVVNKGDTVVLNVTNPRGSVHGLEVPAFGIDTGPLEPRGGTATIEFIAAEAGTYTYNCSIPFDPDEDPQHCHPEHEFQVGTIIVLDR